MYMDCECCLVYVGLAQARPNQEYITEGESILLHYTPEWQPLTGELTFVTINIHNLWDAKHMELPHGHTLYMYIMAFH